MPRRLRPGDTDLVWILTVTHGGRVLRWSSWDVSADVTGTDPGGRWCGFLPVRRVRDALDLRGQAPRTAVSVEVFYPPDLSAASIVAAGHRLDGSRAELALLPMSSGAWADRMVLVDGIVADPSYGGAAEPVSFELRRLEHEDPAQRPTVLQTINDLTWPSSADVTAPPGMPSPDTSTTYVRADGADDKPYPIPFGRAGCPTDDTADDVPCVPAYAVHTDGGGARILLVAGCRVAATQCRIHSSDGSWPALTATVTHTADALGQPVTTVNVATAPTDLRTAGSWFTTWPEGSASMPSEPDTALRGAGEVAAWWLRGSHLPRSLVASAAASAGLDAFELGGYVDEPVGHMEWIADRVVGDLPAFLGRDSEGRHAIRPIPWNAPASQAVAHLEVGDGTVLRELPVSVRGDGRAALVEVVFARNAATNEYTRTAYRSIRQGADDQARQVRATSPDVYDPTTASLVAAWLAWRDGAAHPRVSLSVSTDHWGWIVAGEVVTVTDTALELSAVPCVVLEVEHTDRAWRDLVITPTAAAT